jgi:phosphoglycerate kinase
MNSKNAKEKNRLDKLSTLFWSFEMKFLRDLDVKGKRVLMRVDFNVPLDQKGNITDDTRIQEALPSIRYVLDHGGSVILMSHLGRPKVASDPAFSLKPIGQRLSQLLKIPVLFAPDCIGKEAKEMASHLKNGSVLLLENLRFYDAEEHPDRDPSFARSLAELGDLYVNDAFGTAHRAHSSTHSVVSYFKDKAAIGLLMEKELQAFDKLLSSPQHPFYAIIGGAKISSKIGLLKSLLHRIDAIFIGGAMAFTFLKAKGISIGESLYEEAFLSQATEFLNACQQEQKRLFLPIDCVIADKFSDQAQKKTIPIEQGIPPGWRGMDIGPATIQQWSGACAIAKTIFWNGPVGVFEFPSFSKGTFALATMLSQLHAITIVGGGDSVAAVNQLHLKDKFTHVSTGGGAALEYIEYGHLPCVDILESS